MNNREKIARRVAQEFGKGQIVNLGIGIPTLAANYIDPTDNIFIHSENGMLGMIGLQEGDVPNPNYIDAGGHPVKVAQGGIFFDSVTSFDMIRGGHVHHTVLGAMEVDMCCNIANWMVPGKIVTGMGGAMDLVVGAKNVIVAMEHVNKSGQPKILKKCNLPLTAVGVVNRIITEKAVIAAHPARGLVLLEVAPDSSVEEVLDLTDAPLTIPENPGIIRWM